MASPDAAQPTGLFVSGTRVQAPAGDGIGLRIPPRDGCVWYPPICDVDDPPPPPLTTRQRIVPAAPTD